jgi:outer membrane protein
MKISYLFPALLTLFSIASYAQDSKIGFADVDYILSKIPETKSIQSQLDVFKGQLQGKLQALGKTLSEKVAEYEQKVNEWPPILLEEKAKEIQKLDAEYQQLQSTISQQYMLKEQKLFEPILTKIQNAIEEVGKEGDYVGILNKTVFIFANDQKVVNISDEVLGKLGVSLAKND